jgi:hypothetical protein
LRPTSFRGLKQTSTPPSSPAATFDVTPLRNSQDPILRL